MGISVATAIGASAVPLRQPRPCQSWLVLRGGFVAQREARRQVVMGSMAVNGKLLERAGAGAQLTAAGPEDAQQRGQGQSR